MVDGVVIDQDRQLEKLHKDSKSLSLDVDRWHIRQCLSQAVEGTSTAVIKLVIARAGVRRGYQCSDTGSEILTLRSPVPDYPSSLWERGISADFSQVRLAMQPALAGIKHLNRLEQVLASRNWKPDIHERILCDMENQLICGTRTNLFWAVGDRLVTPSLSTCGVSGMMREKILDLARAAGMDIVVDRQPPAALMTADEAFLSNSLIGIWPIRQLAERFWVVPGPITHRLASMLKHSWQGIGG